MEVRKQAMQCGPRSEEEEGRKVKEEGRSKKQEGRRKKQEGRRKEGEEEITPSLSEWETFQDNTSEQSYVVDFLFSK